MRENLFGRRWPPLPENLELGEQDQPPRGNHGTYDSQPPLSNLIERSTKMQRSIDAKETYLRWGGTTQTSGRPSPEQKHFLTPRKQHEFSVRMGKKVSCSCRFAWGVIWVSVGRLGTFRAHNHWEWTEWMDKQATMCPFCLHKHRKLPHVLCAENKRTQAVSCRLDQAHSSIVGKKTPATRFGHHKKRPRPRTYGFGNICLFSKRCITLYCHHFFLYTCAHFWLDKK